MTLVREHMPYYDIVFRLEGFIKDPVLVFGRHDLAPSAPGTRRRNVIEFWLKRYRPIGGVRLHPNKIPHLFQGAKNVQDALKRYGAREVLTLDYFDTKADILHDMNNPIPSEYRHRFGTLIDIGSIEHVFDTRQCLINMIEFLFPGGHLFLTTTCAGYYNHGFHVFSPECLIQALELNGFVLRWVTYTTPSGLELDSPQYFKDVLIWIVAQKTRPLDHFICPQQGRWRKLYNSSSCDGE